MIMRGLYNLKLYPFSPSAGKSQPGSSMTLTFSSPSDILPFLEVRRSLVGLLDFKSSVGG